MEASVKTTRVNAYFAGIGRTKQVVLYDTLLATSSREEVRLVVAHELGHWELGHVVKGLLLSGILVLAGLWTLRLSISQLAGASGPASLLPMTALENALVVLFVFATLASFALSPVSSYVSRRFEVQSDAYSLALTGDRGAFVSTQIALAKGNLGDVEPPPFIRWFAWTHPTTLERIRSASSF
jgi:STE24 endopeptidase